MESFKKNLKKIDSNVVLLSILFLFFLQLISDFLETIYALNLIEVELNENILALLFLLTPIILLLFKKGVPNKYIIVIGEILVISRVLGVFFNGVVKMVITGIGAGFFLLFLPLYLQKLSVGNKEKYGIECGLGLAIAVLFSIFFRVLGSSVDISTFSWFQSIGWILAFIEAILIYNTLNREEFKESSISDTSKEYVKPVSTLKILGLSIGIIGIIVLIYFAFSSPAVISRWAEGNYFSIIYLLTIEISVFILLIVYKPELLNALKFWMLLLWNILFVFALVVLIMVNHTFFVLVEYYPVIVSPTSLFSYILLYMMLALSPIILIDFILLSREIIISQPSVRKIGGSFTVASVLLLVLILANVFTIVWDYIPLVGNFFRDMYWFVFFLTGVFIIVPILLVRKIRVNFTTVFSKLKIKILFTAIISIILSGVIIVGIILELPSEQPIGYEPNIRVLSYNIQQGFDEFGNKNPEGQTEVILQANPTIIGLQESDTCRISSGNLDIVRYINDRLNYYSYFGPKTTTGTFGIALLSKYPILNPRTFYMETEGEQTATIEAQIIINAKVYFVYVTHLGNYKHPLIDTSQYIEQEQLLRRIVGRKNVILMGDFNFHPYTEQYNLTTNILNDCWEIANNSLIWNPPKGWLFRLPHRRIDHIFVSDELNNSISGCYYFGGTASDHPAVAIDIRAY